MSTAKKTLILHIGSGKTGTTAIQQTFWKNQAALAAAGIAYPKVGAVAGAHHLISPFMPSHIAARLGWTSIDTSEWIEDVAGLPEPVVFMSSELIWSAEPEAVTSFCAALLPVFDLRICIYLRRQDDMIEAVYHQGVKGGVQCHKLEAILRKDVTHYDYFQRLAPWSDAVGRDRLIVLPYERGQFHQGDLIRDVLFRALGLPHLPPGFLYDPKATPNARFSLAATEFKRLVNGLMPDPSQSMRFNAALSMCPPDTGKTHMLKRADRLRLIEQFAESNARVARDLMGRPEGNLFYESPEPTDLDITAEPDAVALRGIADRLAQDAPDLLVELGELVFSEQRTDGLSGKAAESLRPVLGSLTENLPLLLSLRSHLHNRVQAVVRERDKMASDRERVRSHYRKRLDESLSEKERIQSHYQSQIDKILSDRERIRSHYKNQINEITSSLSWRVTSPLRRSSRGIRRLVGRAFRLARIVWRKDR